MSLLLDEKEPKNQGRHQGPSAHGGRPSPMSAIARAPSPVERRQARLRCFILGGTRSLQQPCHADRSEGFYGCGAFTDPFGRHRSSAFAE